MIKKQTDQVLQRLHEISVQVDGLNRDIQNILETYGNDDIKTRLVEDISAGKLKKISTALIQRKFKIGYSRAARLMDVLAQDGYVAQDFSDTYGNTDIKALVIKDYTAGKIKKVSTSWIQRRFGVGYSRAALIMDELVRSGLIK